MIATYTHIAVKPIIGSLCLMIKNAYIKMDINNTKIDHPTSVHTICSVLSFNPHLYKAYATFKIQAAVVHAIYIPNPNRIQSI